MAGEKAYESEVHRSARASLASVVAAAALITINHLPVLGWRAPALGVGLLGAATGFLLRYRARRRWPALAGYLLVNLWIVFGFGLYKGLWKGALRLYLGTLLAWLSPSFPKPVVSGYLVETSAVAMFIASLLPDCTCRADDRTGTRAPPCGPRTYSCCWNPFRR